MATFTAVTVAMDLREMVQVLVTVLSPVLVGSICRICKNSHTHTEEYSQMHEYTRSLDEEMADYSQLLP